MTKQYYSKQELFTLRNRIPITRLIESLKMPVRTSDGYFRFSCPKCGKHKTAVNPKTNLARCFCCNKNYNPIDLVIAVKGMSFTQSVSYLKPFLNEPEKARSSSISSSVKTTSSSLVPLKSIIESMNLQTNSRQKTLHLSPPPDKIIETLAQRIDNLEQQIANIANKLCEIEQHIQKS